MPGLPSGPLERLKFNRAQLVITISSTRGFQTNLSTQLDHRVVYHYRSCRAYLIVRDNGTSQCEGRLLSGRRDNCLKTVGSSTFLDKRSVSQFQELLVILTSIARILVSPRTTTDPELYRQARSALGPPPPEDPLSDSSSESPTSHGRQLTPTGGPSLPEIRPQISAPKQIEPLPTTPLVEKDFRARFVDRRPRESRVSSLTSLISSEESFSLSISPVHGDSLAGMRPGLQSRRITTSSSSPPLHELFSNRRPPEVLLSRTLSGSSSRLSSRGGGCLRLKDRQGQESQLSKLIEEEKKIADE